VEKLFQRALLKVLNIELWKIYLTYIRDTKASLDNYNAKMAQAYDFALDHMGMDFFSYSIWTDYILFLKNVDVAGSYAENQKISQIRKIYHRGIVIPMLNVETLWYALVFLVLEKFILFDFVVSSLFIKLGKSTLRSNRVSIP